MKIAFDLDNTITEYPSFFSFLTKMLSASAEITILTARENTKKSYEKIKKELKKLNISYHRIAITSEKANFIIDNQIDVFFEDTDEYFLELPPEVCVFKIREPGNFDFSAQKWIYGKNTGINIDKRKKQIKSE